MRPPSIREALRPLTADQVFNRPGHCGNRATQNSPFFHSRGRKYCQDSLCLYPQKDALQVELAWVERLNTETASVFKRSTQANSACRASFCR